MTVRMLSSFRMEIPKFLSLLAERDSKAFVPGINDLLKGGYPLERRYNRALRSGED